MSLTGIAFFAAFLAGTFLALLRRPMFGLLTYVGVFFLSPADRWWGEGWLRDVRWSLLAAALTLASMLIHRGKLRQVSFWSRGPVVGLLLFVSWLAVQLLWVQETQLQMGLLVMFAKFFIVVFMIVRCVDSEKSLRLFLWAHVLGTFYFGWIVFQNYGGGRFEGFGGPGLDDANAGALALATGVLAAAGLFIAGGVREKLATAATMPLVLNGLVATISRSGFLALAFGGAVFNFFTPPRLRGRVLALSLIGLVAVLMVTNQDFWARMSSIKYAGAEVADVDTGGGRLEIMQAQVRMFRDHPLGCGHRCTALLSPSYLDDKYLTGSGEERARSSHNTFMSLLVEQGVPGGVAYVLLLAWLIRSLMRLLTRSREPRAADTSLVPAIAAVLAGIMIGDMFVDFLKFEIRIWFVAILILLGSDSALPKGRAEESTP